MANHKLDLKYFEPIEAIVFYKSDDASIYPCAHGISKLENGDYVILKPKQISKSFIRNMYQNICGNNAKTSSFIPENLLYLGSDRMLWWNGYHEKYIFKTENHGKITFSIKNATFLFVYGPKIGFHVYLVKGTKRPSENTKIFDFPIYNVSDGEICLGTTKVPEFDSKDLNGFIEKMTEAFFFSKFTNEGSNEIEKIWNDVAKTGIFDLLEYNKRFNVVNDLVILL